MKAFLGRLLGFLLFLGIAYALVQWLVVPYLAFQLDDETLPRVVVYRVPYPLTTGRFKTPGVVLPFEEKEITSPVTGKVLEVYVSQGDLLDEGSPLFRIDTKGARQRLLNLQTQAQSLLEQDETVFDDETRAASSSPESTSQTKPIPTVTMTLPKKKGSADSPENVESPEDVLRSDIRRQARLLSDAIVHMPYRGQVKTVLVEAESTIQKGEPAIRVDGGHDLDVKIQLTWDDLNRLKLKQEAMIESLETAFPLRYKGTVISIENKPITTKQLTGAAIIRIPRFAQPQFTPKQDVMVHMAFTRPGRLSLPRETLHYDGLNTFVFLARPKVSPASAQQDKTRSWLPPLSAKASYVITRHPVTVDVIKGGSATIHAGLLPGDLIVLRSLRAGPIPLRQAVSVQYDEARYEHGRADH